MTMPKAPAKTFKPDFVVNYGVNDSHRRMNCKLFTRYKDALAFYTDEIDREVWQSGEVLRLDYDSAGYVCQRVRKNAYGPEGERSFPRGGQRLPVPRGDG